MSAPLRLWAALCATAGALLCLPACPDTGGNAPGTCTPGELDCECTPDATCGTLPDGTDLRCVAGTCSSCVPGQADCVCQSGMRCGPDLVCTPEDVCTTPACDLGTLGCGCLGDGGCANSNLHCSSNGVCTTPGEGCSPGTLDCPCDAGGCGPDLMCYEGRVCVDASGYDGGPCFEDGGCYDGNRCEHGRCTLCKPGSQGCDCTSAGECNTGLQCIAGSCLQTTGLAVQKPVAAGCTTPCSTSLTDDDGVYRECVDGLMDGCLPGRDCIHGQCLDSTEQRRGCTLDTQCPEFQTCLSGYCVPNCDADTDCVVGAICFRRVCRLTCDSDGQLCPDDLECRLLDGRAGICLPSSAGPDSLVPEAPSSFSLSETSLTFTSQVTESSFTITNDGATSATFEVRRSQQRTTNPQGTLETTSLGNVDHGLTPPTSCVVGTLGCQCAPGDAPCAPLASGLALSCDNAVSAGPTCRPASCDQGVLGCVCRGEDCRRYCDGPSCPLWWLELAVTRVADVLVPPGQHIAPRFVLAPGETAEVTLAAADGSSADWYQGAFEVTNLADGRHETVSLSYARRPEGAWGGQIYYFGDFRVSETGLQTWIDNGRLKEDVAGAQNAFIRAWGNFRTGDLDYDLFEALLTSTRTESWRLPQVQQGCPDGAICYPAPGPTGLATYSNDAYGDSIPSGVVELPIAVTLARDGGNKYGGRVNSVETLHYPGMPRLQVEFSGDPAQCTNTTGIGCLVFLEAFDFESSVGGRYESAACDSRFEQIATPWLIPGFLAEAQLDNTTGTYQTRECRDREAPYASTAVNTALARANPIPDGHLRTRKVELIDGALINNQTLFVLFQETMAPWIDGGKPTRAYGFMLLSRQERSLDPNELQGSPPQEETFISTTAPTCDQDLLDTLNVTSIAADPAGLAAAILEGVTESALDGAILSTDDETVHYLCVDNGTFDGGADAYSAPIPCPAGSQVRFFTVSDTLLPAVAGVMGAACQQTGTCPDTLAAWEAQGLVIQSEPFWLCQDDTRAYCSDNRYDLRADKTFFKVVPDTKVFMPLPTAVDDAFRYRTRFQNRAGKNLGFVPDLCIEGSDAIPYCYDAGGIEQVEQRVDCLLHLYVDYGATIKLADQDVYSSLRSYLLANFAFDAELDPLLNITVYHSGFEKLYAELLTMLGDDAYTKALSSRFDLAGLSIAAFQGSLFEPDGINLSGVAGAEMSSLYQATQYYRKTLDRFFKLLPRLTETLLGDPSDQIFGQESVDTYLGRVIRASTQKARVWSEVAKRYQNFNRSDLARGVIERGYVEAYLESIVLTHLMQNIVEVSLPEDVDQIVAAIRTAQLTYAVALSDMRERYEALNQSVDYFGFPADYMPFPAVEAQIARDNGFEVAANRAWQRVQLALQAEEAAISTTRSFDSDSASFQNELTRLENTYESQLLDICGSFEVSGKVYPAITKYAYLTPETRAVGDPCGLVGTGSIHQTLGDMDIALNRIAQVRTQISNTLAEVAIERERIDKTCDTKDAWEQALVETRGKANNLSDEIDDKQLILSELDRSFQAFSTIAKLNKCSVVFGLASGGDCPASKLALAMYLPAIAGIEVTHGVISQEINDKQSEIRDLQLEESKITFDLCDADGNALVQIDSAARVKTILLRLAELELSALEAQYQLQQVAARLKQLHNQHKRVRAELAEMTQLTINVEAARNDPNIRIYRNDAIINADITFFAALREVYKATRVYEYYTSQSYADKDQLFLIRMVNRGDYNLQNYLIELEDTYRLFEDEYGTPDLRLEMVSFRDDVLQIPRVTPEGRPLSQAERFTLFRERLTDGGLLDANGHIVAPFSLGPQNVSPLTRNHKIRHLEAELEGSGIGASLARVYVKMAGTSTIQSLTGGSDFVVFPERTGVVNTFKNATKLSFYEPDVYKNRRFTDRPLMNSRWELIFNLKDEPANADLDVANLTDILLYFYYSDFTAL